MNFKNWATLSNIDHLINELFQSSQKYLSFLGQAIRWNTIWILMACHIKCRESFIKNLDIKLIKCLKFWKGQWGEIPKIKCVIQNHCKIYNANSKFSTYTSNDLIFDTISIQFWFRLPCLQQSMRGAKLYNGRRNWILSVHYERLLSNSFRKKGQQWSWLEVFFQFSWII